MEKQLAVLNKKLNYFKQDSDINGALLMGSVAYEKAGPNSDLDIMVLTNVNKFESEYIDNIFVETHFCTYENAMQKLNNNPTEVYKYLYSKILFDNGKISELLHEATAVYNNYITDEKTKNEIKHWLSSTKLKLNNALTDYDFLKLSYLTSTNCWKVLEGVWAVNNKPMPPSSLAFHKHNELTLVPYKDWFSKLFTENAVIRAKNMLHIIDWIIINL